MAVILGSDSADLAARLERIKQLTAEYLSVRAESSKARKLAARIQRERNAGAQTTTAGRRRPK